MAAHERDYAPAPLELEGAPTDLEVAGLEAFDAPSPARTPRDEAGVPEEKESEARESLDSCLASISSEMARLNGLLEQHKDGSAIEHIRSLEEGHLSSLPNARALFQKFLSRLLSSREKYSSYLPLPLLSSLFFFTSEIQWISFEDFF